MSNYLGIDYGSHRLGLAIASDAAKLAKPLPVLENGPNVLIHLHEILTEEGITDIIVGQPRGLDGQETNQTRVAHEFVERLKEVTNCTIHLQDEAGTSLEAKARKHHRKDAKTAVDSEAAAIILQDFLNTL